jgi:hypothetical protein
MSDDTKITNGGPEGQQESPNWAERLVYGLVEAARHHEKMKAPGYSLEDENNALELLSAKEEEVIQALGVAAPLSADPAYSTPWKTEPSFGGDIKIMRPDRREPSGFYHLAFLPKSQAQVAEFIVAAINSAIARRIAGGAQ